MAKDRSSEAHVPTLITDRRQIAEKEAENALKQFDQSMIELQKALKSGHFKLKPSLLLKLNRIALDGISSFAGNYRPAGVDISGSKHVPLNSDEVPSAVEEMCEYVNEQWERKTAVHLSSYVLWRLNWIHPFVDGNGRTARAVSYLVLCAKLKTRLPGKNTIPEQIADNKRPYYEALELADEYQKANEINVTALEEMLNAQLAKQLVAVHESATGKNFTSVNKLDAKVESQIEPTLNGLGAVQWMEKHPVIVGAIVAIALAMLSLMFAK
jgi:Fic family protein